MLGVAGMRCSLRGVLLPGDEGGGVPMGVPGGLPRKRVGSGLLGGVLFGLTEEGLLRLVGAGGGPMCILYRWVRF